MAARQFSEVQFGFDVRTKSPIDRRLVLTKDEMESMQLDIGCGKVINLASVMPDKYLVICEENGRLYRYSRLSNDDCSDCKIPDKAGWPYASPNGHFRLFTDVTDVVALGYHVEDGKLVPGESWESIVDKCGIAKVCSQEDVQVIIDELNTRFTNLDAALAEKVSTEELCEVQKQVDKLEENTAKLDVSKQDKFIILGDGDTLNSEGLPQPAPGTDGYGVHVAYSDDGPDIGDGKKGPKILISHESVVPAGGWISKYAIGGIAIGQAFPEGTKISEVWRQLLEGDPKADNVLCAAVAAVLPQYWTDLAWRQFTVKRNDLVKITSQTPFEWKAIPFDQWQPVVANQQYIMISLPLSMINEPGTDLAEERPVKLAEVYNVASPMFTYDWSYYDIKNNPNADENGYRVYYLTNKITGTLTDLVWEFANND